MSKLLTKEQWHKRKKIKKIIKMTILISMVMIILAVFIYIIGMIVVREAKKGVPTRPSIEETLPNGTVVKLRYLTPNEFSRPQTKLKKVNGIVIHYTANPGTTAEQNRNYFEGLAESRATYASSHYIVGLEGEIVQCVPLTEVSYASNERNNDTIAIECCHPDGTGQFTRETYDSLVSLAAALYVEFNLEEEDIIRHYDVTGKLCPLYYVEHEEDWNSLKASIMQEADQIQLSRKQKRNKELE